MHMDTTTTKETQMTAAQWADLAAAATSSQMTEALADDERAQELYDELVGQAARQTITLHGRTFEVAGPTQYTTFRTWTLTGPGGSVHQVVQHDGAKWQRSLIRPTNWRTGRDLYIKGNAAVVEVQPDGTLVSA